MTASSVKPTDKHALNLAQQKADMCEMLALPAGQRVLLRLIEHTQMMQPSYSGNPTDTAFREGQRNEGLFMVGQIIEADPMGWLKLQQLQLKQTQEQELDHERNQPANNARSQYDSSSD